MTALHYRINEHGKLLALRGDHGEALRHYREAMRLAVESQAPEASFRHYAWCVLESLERAGHLAEVVGFCERAEAHYTAAPPVTDVAKLDLAAHRERHGIALLKLGDLAGARDRLAAAVAVAPLPLATTVLGWLRTGLTIPPSRLAAEQDRRRYWTVRPDAVDAALALPLPSLR